MDEKTALDDAGLSPRDRLILEHMPLLRHVVGRTVSDCPPGMDREELEAIGMLGLIAAADSWDESRGLKFSTYAFPKIRGAILDELRRQDFLPRGRREKVRALDGIVKQIEQERGAPPEPKELAERMGVSELEVDEILASARLSMQASLDEGPSEQLGALLSDPRSQDPVGSASWEETKELLAVRIGELPEQERRVVQLYYGEELLLKEIGELLGVTESRVSQIHSRAIYRLNASMGASVEAP